MFDPVRLEGVLKGVENIIRGGSPPTGLIESCGEILDELLRSSGTTPSFIPLPMGTTVMTTDILPLTEDAASSNEAEAIINLAIKTHNKSRGITHEKNQEIRSLLRSIAACLLYRYSAPTPKSISQVVRLLSRVRRVFKLSRFL